MFKIAERKYGRSYLHDLETSFEKCTKSRYLKLKCINLELYSALLWWALSQAHLKQLCLKSLTRKPSNPEVLLRSLPRIFETLEVLHVHASYSENADAFNTVIMTEVTKINSSPKTPSLDTPRLRLSKRIGFYIKQINSRRGSHSRFVTSSRGTMDRTLCKLIPRSAHNVEYIYPRESNPS